jgi:uncharacterized protein YqeY
MESEASDLKDRLAAEMKEALKGGQKIRLAALRLLAAAVKNREVELRREVSEEEFLEVVGRQVKQRRESIEAYERGGREELAAREREEKGVLEAYLPAQLSEEEVAALVEGIVEETSATGPADVGKVMGALMARARGRVDGKRAQSLVLKRLRG